MFNIIIVILLNSIPFALFYFVTVCTPVGFARMFTVLGQYIVKPQVRQEPVMYEVSLSSTLGTKFTSAGTEKLVISTKKITKKKLQSLN